MTTRIFGGPVRPEHDDECEQVPPEQVDLDFDAAERGRPWTGFSEPERDARGRTLYERTHRG